MELLFIILDVYLKKECKLNRISKSRVLLTAATVHFIPAVFGTIFWPLDSFFWWFSQFFIIISCLTNKKIITVAALINCQHLLLDSIKCQALFKCFMCINHLMRMPTPWNKYNYPFPVLQIGKLNPEWEIMFASHTANKWWVNNSGLVGCWKSLTLSLNAQLPLWIDLQKL